VTKVDANQVVVERFIQAAPDRVFKALTHADEIERWFFTDVTTDPRPGGGYAMWWRSATEPQRDHDRVGRYLEFIPGRKLVFEWQGSPDCPRKFPWDKPTVVTITLSPEGTGTCLKLVHTGFDDTDTGRDSCKAHAEGWNFYADQLGRYLTGGPDLRAEKFGQKIK
jgi:uncharacterized protein YndB with AHSA1/START domain